MIASMHVMLSALEYLANITHCYTYVTYVLASLCTLQKVSIYPTVEN